MIEIKNVSKKFKEVILFKDLTIAFESGKKILITGVNGSGKSILLKLIVGYSKPDVGEIMIDGNKLGVNNDFINNAGLFINAPEFMGNVSGLDNLLHLANINKITTEEKIMEFVRTFNMEDSINKKYKTYSLGMKQKIRIIQALMEEPNYLIIDEPFDGLDKNSQEMLKNILDNFISDQNNTLIFTTHSSEYELFADTIYKIDNFTLTEGK